MNLLVVVVLRSVMSTPLFSTELLVNLCPPSIFLGLATDCIVDVLVKGFSKFVDLIDGNPEVKGQGKASSTGSLFI